MSRSGRLLQLLSLLSGRRRWRPRELASRLDVSIRTVFRDLAELAANGAPVEVEDGSYRLSDSYPAAQVRLSPRERAVLRIALANPALRRQRVLARTTETRWARSCWRAGADASRAGRAD